MNFCKRVKILTSFGLGKGNQCEAFRTEWLDKWDINEDVKNALMNAFSSREQISETNHDGYYAKIKDEVICAIYDCISDNIWYDYFIYLYENNLMMGENWIDFESEIRDVIKYVDGNSSSLQDYIGELREKSELSSLGMVKEQKIEYFFSAIKWDKYDADRNIKGKHTVKHFREKTYHDLQMITFAFELYISKVINTIKVMQKMKEVAELKPDFVMSFNYSDTYERAYNNCNVSRSSTQITKC